MTRREEIIKEMASLREEMEKLDSELAVERDQETIDQLLAWGFERVVNSIDDYYVLVIDGQIKYQVDLIDRNCWVWDEIDQEIIYDEYYPLSTDMLPKLKAIPPVYLVKKTVLAIKYDDGDLDNYEIVKEYKLGS